ncbi:MAG: 50S ribosomal protein L4 [Lentimicrobiaceae bacterium]
MELEVYNIKGEKTARTVTLSDSIYNIEPNDHAIYLDTKLFLANQRQGTHSTLEKSTISGSTRKLKKQKGTGGARAGSIKSPLLRGGARVFGPRPRDYGFKINQKVKELARISALSYKAKNNGIIVLEELNIEKPKTKTFIELLDNLKLSGKRTLMVLSESNKTLYLSSRNLKQARVIRACDLNTYEILHAQNLIILEGSIAEIEKVFQN